MDENDKVVIDRFTLEDTNEMLYSIVIDRNTKQIVYSLDCSCMLQQLKDFSESGKKCDVVYLKNAKYYNTFCMLLHSIFHLKKVDLPSENVTGIRYYRVDELPDGIVESFLDYGRLERYLKSIGVSLESIDGSSVCPLCDMHMKDLMYVLSRLPYRVRFCPFCGKELDSDEE